MSIRMRQSTLKTIAIWTMISALVVVLTIALILVSYEYLWGGLS